MQNYKNKRQNSQDPRLQKKNLRSSKGISMESGHQFNDASNQVQQQNGVQRKFNIRTIYRPVIPEQEERVRKLLNDQEYAKCSILLKKDNININRVINQMKDKWATLRFKMAVFLFHQKLYQQAMQYCQIILNYPIQLIKLQLSRWNILMLQCEYMSKMSDQNRKKQTYNQNETDQPTIIMKNGLRSLQEIIQSIQIITINNKSKQKMKMKYVLQNYYEIFQKRNIVPQYQNIKLIVQQLKKQYKKHQTTPKQYHKVVSCEWVRKILNVYDNFLQNSPVPLTLLEIGYIDSLQIYSNSYFKLFKEAELIYINNQLFQSLIGNFDGASFQREPPIQNLSTYLNYYRQPHMLSQNYPSPVKTNQINPIETTYKPKLNTHTFLPQIYSKNKKLRGLSNLGNTCYMNSGLQCLFHTSYLTQYFSNQNPNSTKFLKSYSEFVKQMLKDEKYAVYPIQLKKQIGNQNSLFDNCKQHDSCQLITTVINSIHSDLNNVVYSKYEVKYFQDPVKHCNEFIVKDQHRTKSVIDQIIFGRFKTQYKCYTCHKGMRLFQKFSVVHLPIISKFKYDLKQFKDCIAQFNSKDQLTGENQLICNNCQQCRSMSKSMSIFKTGKVVIFSLKRFNQYSKLFHHVDMPCFITLNLMKGVLQNYESPIIYELYGVINHSGTLSFGHYTADCQYNNIWYEFNDSYVRQIGRDYKVKKQGYVFFYRIQSK